VDHIIAAYGEIGYNLIATVELGDDGLKIVMTVRRSVGALRQCWAVFRHAVCFCRLFGPAQVELDTRYPGSGYTTTQFMREWAGACREAEDCVGVSTVHLVSIYSNR